MIIPLKKQKNQLKSKKNLLMWWKWVKNSFKNKLKKRCNKNSSQKYFKLLSHQKAYEDLWIPREVQVKLGSFLVYLMKESIKIKNEYGFWIPLFIPSYRKILEKDGYIGVLNLNEGFLQSKSNLITKRFKHENRKTRFLFSPFRSQSANDLQAPKLERLRFGRLLPTPH